MANEVLIEIEVLEKPGRTMDDARREITADARRVRQDVEQVFDRIDLDVDTKVNVDRTEIRQADREIRDLDSIPPPTIDVDIDAQQAVGEAEDTFAGIDVGDMGSAIVGQLSSVLKVAGPLGGIVAAAGAVFGQSLAEGIGRGFSANKNRALDEVKFGLGGAQMVDVGRSAGAAWGNGFGESLGELRNTALLLENTLGEVDDSLNLGAATKQAQALNDVFGVDIPTSARLARRLVANDLAPDTVAAFNLMGSAAQKYQLDQDEIFDVLSEFSPVFSKLGVDGAQAMNIIGETVQRGLLPNVDRAAELFEEFNIRVTDNTARDAIEEIGFSFDAMQDAIASGRGGDALAALAGGLLEIEDVARRDALAIEIFGTSIESAADPEAVLQLLATADAVGDVGTAMADAVAVTEQTASGLERLKREAGDAAAVYGGALNRELEIGFGLFDRLIDPLGRSSDEMRGVASEADLASDKLLAMRNEAADAGLSFDDLAGDVEELDGALSAFSDRFDADRIFRSIDDDARRLIESMTDLDSSVLTLGGGFDTTTEAGSRAEDTFERMSGNLDNLIQGFRDGTITSDELAAGQRRVEADIRAAGAAAGFTTDQVDGLVAKYGTVPDDVTTSANLEGNAIDRAAQLQGELNAINGRTVNATANFTTNRTTVFRQRGSNTIRFAGGGIASAAEGGARENTVMVNDGAGPEIARLPDGDLVDLPTGTQVFSAEDSERIRDTGGGGGGVTVVLNVAGSIRSDRDLVALIRDEFQRGGLSGVIAA